MLPKYLFLSFVLVVGLISMANLASPIDAQRWSETSNDGYVGKFAPNRLLDQYTPIDISPHSGPEDIAQDSSGTLYTGTSDGWILRRQSDQTWEKWISTGGHPLGLSFDANDNLYIADAERGLLKIAPTGELSRLSHEHENEKLFFVDDVESTSDGKFVYFSDVTQEHDATQLGVHQASLLETLEHSGSGRILVYDAEKNTTRVVIDGLQFANGVSLNKDESALFVTETTAYRIVKHWLKGPKQGQTEYLIEGLPGFPDNINLAPDGHFWVALFTPRHSLLESTANLPVLRQLSALLPESAQIKPHAFGHVFKISEDGEVIKSLQAPSGKLSLTTGALQSGNTLYVGNLSSNMIAELDLKNL